MDKCKTCGTAFVESRDELVKALKDVGKDEAELWLNDKIDELKLICKEFGFKWEEISK